MLKFFKDFFIYGFASVFSKIAAVLLMPVYTNILTREEYGAMAMLVSVKGIIDLVSNLNIHAGIARDYYEKDINRTTLVSTGFWSILSLSCFIMVIMLLSKDYWTRSVLDLEEYSSSFILLLVSIPTGSLMSYFSILTRFKKKPLLFSLGILGSLLIQLSIAIYTIVFLRIGIIGFFWATVISQLFSIVYFAMINREYISYRFKWLYLKSALLFAFPTLPAILAWWLDSSLGQILVGKYLSLQDLGVYSAALQFVSVFALIGTALNNVWTPFLYENYKKENFQIEVERLFLMFILILCALSSTLCLLSEEFILLLSNSNYLDASIYLTLLCIPMGFYLFFPIVSSGITISRDTKYIGISYVLGSVSNLLFLLFFLPELGVICVPVGLGISRVITYVVMYTVTKKKGLLLLPNKFFIVYVALILVCFGVVYFSIELIYRIFCIFIINIMLYIIANRTLQINNLIKLFMAKTIVAWSKKE